MPHTRNLRKALSETDWLRFAQQKTWLAGESLKNNEVAMGLLAWIDDIQDAAVEDGLIDEYVMFPFMLKPPPGAARDFWTQNLP